MQSFVISLITVAALLVGLRLGSAVRRRSPEDDLHGESLESLRIAVGIIATLVALLAGLLISAAKSSFDQANAETTEAATTVILLDRALADYGPDAEPIRQKLRVLVQDVLNRHWGRPFPTDPDAPHDETLPSHVPSLDNLLRTIRTLNAPDDLHHALRDHAIARCNDLIDTRWLLFEQAQSPMPTLFLAFLIGWLGLLGIGLGVVTPYNRTTKTALVICSLAMAAAIFLIVELNLPFQGLVQISPAALENALRHLGP